MAIALIHMLPESVEDYEEWATNQNIIHPFPLPFCCVFIGYIIVLCVDRVIVHNIMEKFHGHHHHNQKSQCVIEPANTAVCAHDHKIKESNSHMPHVHIHSKDHSHSHEHKVRHIMDSDVEECEEKNEDYHETVNKIIKNHR